MRPRADIRAHGQNWAEAVIGSRNGSVAVSQAKFYEVMRRFEESLIGVTGRAMPPQDCELITPEEDRERCAKALDGLSAAWLLDPQDLNKLQQLNQQWMELLAQCCQRGPLRCEGRSTSLDRGTGAGANKAKNALMRGRFGGLYEPAGHKRPFASTVACCALTALPCCSRATVNRRWYGAPLGL